jgi:hypothetical protein
MLTNTGLGSNRSASAQWKRSDSCVVRADASIHDTGMSGLKNLYLLCGLHSGQPAASTFDGDDAMTFHRHTRWTLRLRPLNKSISFTRCPSWSSNSVHGGTFRYYWKLGATPSSFAYLAKMSRSHSANIDPYVHYLPTTLWD